MVLAIFLILFSQFFSVEFLIFVHNLSVVPIIHVPLLLRKDVQTTVTSHLIKNYKNYYKIPKIECFVIEALIHVYILSFSHKIFTNCFLHTLLFVSNNLPNLLDLSISSKRKVNNLLLRCTLVPKDHDVKFIALRNGRLEIKTKLFHQKTSPFGILSLDSLTLVASLVDWLVCHSQIEIFNLVSASPFVILEQSYIHRPFQLRCRSCNRACC